MEVTEQQTLRINFELGPKDIEYFKGRLAKARKNRALRDDDRVILAAEALAVKALESDPPTFVVSRMLTLQNMVAMLKDRDWNLENDDRARVLEVLAYFADPNDIIPDDLPGIGFLDDTIMVDLAAFDLAPELEAYADFCDNRDDLAAKEADAQPLKVARDELQSRMRRRRRRRTGGAPGSDMITSLFHAG
ncbi:MAG: YkvA family protein [Hyphomonadaceae bacterium]|nr:YkvA family protein [Hyphomonadaceae bacterium]